MTMNSAWHEAGPWASVMGRDLPRAERQPLQEVRLDKNGAMTITRQSLEALKVAEGERLRVRAAITYRLKQLVR